MWNWHFCRWQQWVSGPDHHWWWNMGCTHYPRNQATVNALAPQWISLQVKFKQTVGVESDVHSVLGQMGILLVDFLARGETANTEFYWKTLQKLQWAIQNKWCGMLRAGVVLLHENAQPHTRFDDRHISRRSSAGRCLIIHFISRTLHPVISIFFLHLKKFLSSQHFENDREVEMSVTQRFQSQEIRLLWHMDIKVGPTGWQMSQLKGLFPKWRFSMKSNFSQNRSFKYFFVILR